MNEAKSKDLLALSKNQPKKIPSQISFFGERPLLEGVAVNEEFLRLRWRFAQDDRGLTSVAPYKCPVFPQRGSFAAGAQCGGKQMSRL